MVGVSFPANDVGRDYYDFLLLDAYCSAIAIGDVTDIIRAADGSLAKGGLHSQVCSNAHPSDVIAAMNQLIAASGSKRDLMTLAYGTVDTTTQTVALAAGHPPVYHYHADTGVVEAIEYSTYSAWRPP